MKLYLDSANINEIKEWSWIIDGVTTNPTLLSRENKNFKELALEICNSIQMPVSVEVISLNAKEMVKEAEDLASISEHVVIKIPMTKDGLKAVKELSPCIKTNVTLIFSVNQALLAAKAGATYASIFVGRLDDTGSNGLEIVKNTADIFKMYKFNTEIITASVRNLLHIIEAAKSGSHIATIPSKVLALMFKHNLTDIGLEQFLDDWNKKNVI